MKAILCTRFGTADDLVLTDIAEPVAGPGENKDPDWIIDDATLVRLRPERTQGRTRVYTITITCTDGSGQTSTKQVSVAVENGG